MNSVCGAHSVDLLDHDGMDYESMSAERRQQLMAPTPPSSEAKSQQNPQYHDITTNMVVDSEVSHAGKDQPCVANHNGQARIGPGRDLQSFDVAPAPRLIKAHRRPRSRNSRYNSAHRRTDHCYSGFAKYFDRDAVPTKRAHLSTSRGRNTPPETKEHTSAAASVAPMADFDAREERDYDRRGTDSYRGGGNKRRRDGELLIATVRSCKS